MSLNVVYWRLNRLNVKQKSFFYEYVGYVKSESRPQDVYHAVVRVVVSKYRLKLHSYMCECPYFVFKGKCKHVKALYETVKKDVIDRLAYDMPLDGDIS
jgi:predicted nucleic acid-binding Zn finger protein